MFLHSLFNFKKIIPFNSADIIIHSLSAIHMSGTVCLRMFLLPLTSSTFFHLPFLSSFLPKSFGFILCQAINHFLHITQQIHFGQCTIFLQHFTDNIASICSNTVTCSLFFYHSFFLFLVFFSFKKHNSNLIQSMHCNFSILHLSFVIPHL